MDREGVQENKEKKFFSIGSWRQKEQRAIESFIHEISARV